MHTQDATDFLREALWGCLWRTFGEKTADDPEVFEPKLRRLAAFVDDDEPYWVRQKALAVILELGKFRTSSGLETPAAVVTLVITRAKKSLVTRVEKRFDEGMNMVRMFIPLPRKLKAPSVER